MDGKRIQTRFILVVAAAAVGGLVGAVLVSHGTVQAAPDAGRLPADVFAVGNKVNGLGATYQIQGVQGLWICVVPFRSLDDHNAPPQVPRWIYVPAIDGAWSKAGQLD
jgi:hypothetical protein